MRQHDHTQHAGSLMSHGPPVTGHLRAMRALRALSQKNAGNKAGREHVDIDLLPIAHAVISGRPGLGNATGMTQLAAAAPVTFGAALVEFKTVTIGHRSATVHGIA